MMFQFTECFHESEPYKDHIAADIAEMLSADMQKEGLHGRTLTLKLKTASFEVFCAFIASYSRKSKEKKIIVNYLVKFCAHCNSYFLMRILTYLASFQQYFTCLLLLFLILNFSCLLLLLSLVLFSCS